MFYFYPLSIVVKSGHTKSCNEQQEKYLEVNMKTKQLLTILTL